ncbi:MAG: ANTAR domain-containing protein [Candidatus Levybacteria bacterium]|nr:ANTAR domain-containing protein [Candidatus Levybacteria bacterium]
MLSELVVYNHYDFNQFLKQFITVVIQVVPVDSCLIFVYDADKKQLILVGSRKPHSEQIGRIILEKGEGITGWVAEHKKTVAIEKKSYKDARFKFFEDMPEDRYEAFLSVPIINDDGIVGVINLHNKKQYKFSKMEIKTVESLVKIIASAFAEVMLKRKVDQLEGKLAERKIVKRAKGVLMQERHFSEDEAYHFIRKEAMNKRKSMKEISEAVLLISNK